MTILGAHGAPISATPEPAEVNVTEGPRNHFRMTIGQVEAIPPLPFRQFTDALLTCSVQFIQIAQNLRNRTQG